MVASISIEKLAGVAILAAALLLRPANVSAQGYDQPKGSTPLPVNIVSCTTSLPLLPMNAYDVTLSGNCALSLSSTAGSGLQTITVVLRQSGAGGFAPTLPIGVKWPGGITPTPNMIAGNIDLFSFRTTDNGNTWFGGH